MKQNPTPGKFSVSTEYPYSGGKPRDFIAVVDEAGDELARMNPATPRPIAVANAELFASAPDLVIRLAEMTTYAGSLQRAIEYHCNGKMVPEATFSECSHHASMLNGQMKAQDDFDGRLEQEERDQPPGFEPCIR